MVQFLFVALVSVALGKEDRAFQKIEKRYTKDPKKGFELAQKIHKKDKQLAIPYYFESNYYEFKSTQSKKLTDRALALGNAAVYGASFEKKADQQLLEKVQWSDKKESLKEKISLCLEELKTAKNKSKFDYLKGKSLKLFQDLVIHYNESTTLENDVTQKEQITKQTSLTAVTSTESKTITQLSLIDFSKKPTGLERIPSSNQSEEEKIIVLINQARVAKKLTPLTIDSNLVFAARYHAADMARENYFDHDSKNKVNGKLNASMDAFERIRLFYPSFANTENIAAGNSTAEATYNQWFNSPGHYANMFNSSATKVGIGFISDPTSEYGSYWVFCTGID